MGKLERGRRICGGEKVEITWEVGRIEFSKVKKMEENQGRSRANEVVLLPRKYQKF